MEEEFPRKAFYTIGEVSRITGVHTHVLRYWEEQGKLLKPSRRRSRHRLYRPADIQLVLEIKRLREEEKLSLAAMRRQLHPQPPPHLRQGPTVPPSPPNEVKSLLQSIRDELLALKELLD
ncbi:MAG: MerR family transcriptional regulator [Deltaproteobacteria bacterium]|nr:MerR family transcriptional regulator [Deltaproteobacteria bacterium]